MTHAYTCWISDWGLQAVGMRPFLSNAAQSAVVSISLFKDKKQSLFYRVCRGESVSFTGIFWRQAAGAEFQMGVNIKRGIPDVSASSLGEEK